ncbi:peroxynitrite isomerase THAP4-like [Ixodes scapularis]
MCRCCALKCRNRAFRGIRLFKLPKSPRRRKLWLSGIKRGAGWKPPDRTYLCEDHFEPSQFQTRCSDGWRRLKATAVPSLFLHSESQQPAARTSGATLQVRLLTQPLPTTSGAYFVTSDNQRGQASSAARGTLVSAHSTSWQPAARTSGAALQGGLLTQPLPTTSGACFVSIFQGPAYPRVAIPPHPSLQVTSDNQRGQASAAALGTLVSAASTSWSRRICPVLLHRRHGGTPRHHYESRGATEAKLVREAIKSDTLPKSQPYNPGGRPDTVKTRHLPLLKSELLHIAVLVEGPPNGVIRDVERHPMNLHTKLVPCGVDHEASAALHGKPPSLDHLLLGRVRMKIQ